MKDRLLKIVSDFDSEISKCNDLVVLEEIKISFLGKKGVLKSIINEFSGIPKEEKANFGKLLNETKTLIETKLDILKDNLQKIELDNKLKSEYIDVSLPGRKKIIGRPHFINQAIEECIAILKSCGFSVALGPDIDSDYYNFEALNFSKWHPARDMQDTFYVESALKEDWLLRTHTSNTQIHMMKQVEPPIRIISPGACYRNEDISNRSHVMFHQIEGLYIDKGVIFSDLFFVLETFYNQFFNTKVDIRFRPSYFPFVEPGLEVDITCFNCNKKGCSLCKHSGWLEVAGAGLVHTNVLKECGIDSDEYSGFAFGSGIERLIMLRNGIEDIRLFLDNDASLLNQI